MKAIDVHAHLATREAMQSLLKYNRAALEYYQGIKLTEGQVAEMALTPDQMAAAFVAADVKGILVGWDAEANTGHERTSNDHLARVVRDYPQAFLGGFASVDPWKGKMAVREAERAIRELGLMGLKFQGAAQAFYPNDRRFYPLWEKCVELGIPVQFHTGTTGLGAGTPGGLGIHLKYTRPIPYLDDLAADFPELTIIGCHYSWPWQDEMVALLLHKTNVFMELSGWSPKYFSDSFKRELNGRLQDRVMFGSDYPVLQHERLFRDYEKSGLKPEVLEKIFIHNAKRILKLDV